MTQILWHDTVTHGPANYDFWYSLTGPEGPWIEIVSDVPRSGSYDWVVPDTPSDQVRLRVRQDNAEADYMDISDSDLAIVGSSTALSIDLEPEKDATIYEEGNGSVANGSGAYLFTGRSETQNGSSERRALLAFSIADSVPEGSTITSASLELTVSRTISGAQTVNLHRVIEDWSEGPSDPSGQEGGGTSAVAGDVTWIHREYSGTPWSSSGASFEQSASATAQVSDEGSYTFTSTSQLVADIQGWLDDPSSNFGWILVIDSPPSGSAKRFNSRENSSAGTRPTLTVEYQTDLEKPTAAFRVDPVHPDLGELVSFSDESTGGPTSWQWDFGDGQTSQEQNPTHTYTTPGGKTVTLVVTNASGPSSTSLDVRVGPRMRRPSSRLSPTN